LALTPMIVAHPRGNAAVRRLSRARDMLCEALEQKLTLDQVAREAALSPGQFIRAFKAVFGQTPHQVRRRRLLRGGGCEVRAELRPDRFFLRNLTAAGSEGRGRLARSGAFKESRSASR